MLVKSFLNSVLVKSFLKFQISQKVYASNLDVNDLTLIQTAHSPMFHVSCSKPKSNASRAGLKCGSQIIFPESLILMLSPSHLATSEQNEMS